MLLFFCFLVYQKYVVTVVYKIDVAFKFGVLFLLYSERLGPSNAWAPWPGPAETDRAGGRNILFQVTVAAGVTVGS